MSATFCFSVHAAAEPSALARVMEVFAVYGHVPTRLHVERNGAAGDGDLLIDSQLEGLTQEEALLVAKRLGRVISVMQVLWSEKRRCPVVVGEASAHAA